MSMCVCERERERERERKREKEREREREREKEREMKMISLDVNRDLLFLGLSLAADTTIGTRLLGPKFIVVTESSAHPSIRVSKELN